MSSAAPSPARPRCGYAERVHDRPAASRLGSYGPGGPASRGRMTGQKRAEKVKQWQERAERYRRLALQVRSEQNRTCYENLARNCDEVARSLAEPDEPI